MSSGNGANGSTDEALCLACGFCCNGVIFADVKLRRNEEMTRLQAHGLPVKGAGGKRVNGNAPEGALANKGRSVKLAQPCAAFDGCRCRIYEDRPQYCREFECLLLKSVKAGRLRPRAALRIICTAQERVEKVREFLHMLGDTEEHRPLAERFRRTTRRLEEIGLDKKTADLYGDLTLAVQDLNVLLRDAFFP